MPISSYAQMKEKKADVIRAMIDLAKVVDELGELGISVDGQVLIDLKSKLENDNFKVLVIGEFKNGKSTFINSLMGKKVLPAYSTPCTAVINEVVYGEEEHAVLYFKNPLPDEMSTDIQPNAAQHMKKYEGKEIPPIELDIDSLEDYVAIPDPTKNQADSIKELPYSKVILEYPVELCKDGIEVIDSPGLNENGTRTKVTEEYLNSADAIIFVFRCPKIAGQTEMDYITDQIHPRGYRNIFFVCNAINQVPEEERERLIKFGNKKLESLTDFGRKGIFYVNALGALKAKSKHDEGALSGTGMPEFEAALSDYLRNNKGRAKLMQILIPCNSFIEKIEKEQINTYKASLGQDAEALKKKIQDAMPRLDLAEEKKDAVKKKIEIEMTELEKKIAELMNQQYGEIIRGIPKEVDKMELDNQMTINPFKQKDRKDALEKEVVTKIDQYVQKQMGSWIQAELNLKLESEIDRIEDNLGEDIEIFYENLDEFRYDVADVKTSKDISAFERVTATIFGTIMGGPTYGALGATMGFGEVAKRSALTLGATCILALTPLGVGAISAAVVGAGVMQIVTGGKSLTEKYKDRIKEEFIASIEKKREESSKEYASDVIEDIREKFELIVQALDKEVAMEKSKIEELEKDAEKEEDVREEKMNRLSVISKKIAGIKATLSDIQAEIE